MIIDPVFYFFGYYSSYTYFFSYETQHYLDVLICDDANGGCYWIFCVAFVVVPYFHLKEMKRENEINILYRFKIYFLANTGTLKIN